MPEQFSPPALETRAPDYIQTQLGVPEQSIDAGAVSISSSELTENLSPRSQHVHEGISETALTGDVVVESIPEDIEVTTEFDEFETRQWRMRTYGVETLLGKLGFQFGDDRKATKVPSPDTLVSLADSEYGLIIKLFPGEAEIPNIEYLQAYADGMYPVAGDKVYYRHDTTDDHLPAMILGGSELRDYLREISSAALKSGDEQTISKAVKFIDGLTSFLTGSLDGSAFTAPSPEFAEHPVDSKNLPELLSYNAEELAKQHGGDKDKILSLIYAVYNIAREQGVGFLPTEIYEPVSESELATIA